MNKKHFIILTSILLVLIIGLTVNKEKVDAAPYGASQLYTTPVATRGTWYYKENHKIKKWVITAHTSNGRKLYKILPNKSYTYWYNRLTKQSTRKLIKTNDWLDNHMWQAYTFRWHGITSFNSNGWLAGAGDGIYYVPVNKYKNGEYVKALRFGGGARNWLDFYAYKDKNLVR